MKSYIVIVRNIVHIKIEAHIEHVDETIALVACSMNGCVENLILLLSVESNVLVMIYTRIHDSKSHRTRQSIRVVVEHPELDERNR